MLTNWLGRTPPEQRKQAFRKLLKSVFASIDGLQSLAEESERTSRQSH
jgi:hypothetical protein